MKCCISLAFVGFLCQWFMRRGNSTETTSAWLYVWCVFALFLLWMLLKRLAVFLGDWAARRFAAYLIDLLPRPVRKLVRCCKRMRGFFILLARFKPGFLDVFPATIKEKRKECWTKLKGIFLRKQKRAVHIFRIYPGKARQGWRKLMRFKKREKDDGDNSKVPTEKNRAVADGNLGYKETKKEWWRKIFKDVLKPSKLSHHNYVVHVS